MSLVSHSWRTKPRHEWGTRRWEYAQDAIQREKQLKGWSRAKKIALIESNNAARVDLSRNWYDVEPPDIRRALDRVDV